MEKNGPVFKNLLQRQNRQKSVMRKAPRCCHCRKYLAEDPNEIGEDEVANLRKCCRCMIASYCSDDCEQKNWTEIHKFNCDVLMHDPRPHFANRILKSDSLSEKVELLFLLFYQTFLEYASSAQDFNNLHEIVNHYTKSQSDLGIDTMKVHILIMISQILLGEDKNAYIFMKQLAYGEARDSKSLKKDILKEDFLELKNSNFISNEDSLKYLSSLMAKRLFWCVLIAIKINVIEDMKFLLTQYEAYHRKMKKKFWPHPRIINLYTLYILGMDKESFLEDLEFQEKQVEAMLIDWHPILLHLVGHYGYQSEAKYRRKSFLELAVRGLQDFFKSHSFARNYILNYCKSKFPKSCLKELEKDTKVLLNSLETLKDSHWMIKIEMKP